MHIKEEKKEKNVQLRRWEEESLSPKLYSNLQ